MPDIRVFRAGRPTGEPAELGDLEALLRDEGAFVWIDAPEPTDDDVATLRSVLGLHPLVVEDVQHRGQRSKVELYEDQAFVVLRPLTLDADESLEREAEIHALAGPRSLVTFRFGPGADIGSVAARWERQHDVAALRGGALYVLIDEIVDGYLEVVERLEDEADAIEDEIFEDRDDHGMQLLERIFRVKRSTIRMRRLVAPLRHGVDLLQEDERFVAPELAPYYRDVMDHVLRCLELADNVRDVLTSLLELRSGQVANRLSDVAKRLSAWAGIILVPTLIAGIYGMNFEHMPELDWRFGYPLALTMMAISGLVLHRSFKRRGWL